MLPAGCLWSHEFVCTKSQGLILRDNIQGSKSCISVSAKKGKLVLVPAKGATKKKSQVLSLLKEKNASVLEKTNSKQDSTVARRDAPPGARGHREKDQLLTQGSTAQGREVI